MLKFEPVSFMTVTVDGEKHTLVRDELMKNEALANAIDLYEELFKDLETAEYERIKMVLAYNAQKNQLMSMVNEYAHKQYGKEDEPDVDEEDTPSSEEPDSKS